MGRTLRRVLRWSLMSLGVALCAGSLALLAILLIWPSDDFRFLGGRNPILAGVTPPLECTLPGLKYVPPCEYRIYSWNEPYDAVVELADAELKRLGFELSGEKKGKYATWRHADGRSIWIQPGMSRTRREGLAGKGSKDPMWTTVVASSLAPEGWITSVRVLFEPDDY